MEFHSRWAMVAVAIVASACAAESGDDDTTNGSNPSGGSSSSSAGTTASAGTSSTGSGGSSAGGSPASAGTSAVGGTGTTTGGSSATGGSASGGSASTACGSVDANDVISDFESGTAKVVQVAGRDGSWFLYSDGTGTQTPAKIENTPLAAEAGGACDSAFGFHTTGSGFSGWGAGLGTDFAPKGVDSARTAYDASGYAGIALRAKAAGAVTVRISVSDKNTAPEGGVCTDTTDKTDATRCGDYFGKDVLLSADWQDFVIPFSAMAQRGWGLPAAGLEVTQVYTVRAQVKGDEAAPVSFDLWVDDVRFTH